MKLEGVTLELDDTSTSLGDLAVQLQVYTSKVLLVKKDLDLEVMDLEKIKPLDKWSHVETEKTKYGPIYTLRRLSEDTGYDDASFDEDGEDIIMVFREDAFQALTRPKDRKKKKSKQFEKDAAPPP